MSPKYSRTSPSPRYRRLIEQYRMMHLQGQTHLGIPPERTFPGESLPKEAARIKRLIKQTGAKTLLDYGCGKGQQYWPARIADAEEGIEYPDVKAYWGIGEVRCYDPGYSLYNELPTGKFDGVICTDVLEHCPEEDIPWILAELFGYATKFVYANVACFPARKTLPSGGNAHCTIRPTKWWEEQIGRAARSNPAVRYEFKLVYLKGVEFKERFVATERIESNSENHSAA
jgi:hypothetical protein